MRPHFVTCVSGPWVVYDLDCGCQEFIMELSETERQAQSSQDKVCNDKMDESGGIHCQ